MLDFARDSEVPEAGDSDDPVEAATHLVDTSTTLHNMALKSGITKLADFTAALARSAEINKVCVHPASWPRYPPSLTRHLWCVAVRGCAWLCVWLCVWLCGCVCGCVAVCVAVSQGHVNRLVVRASVSEKRAEEQATKADALHDKLLEEATRRRKVGEAHKTTVRRMSVSEQRLKQTMQQQQAELVRDSPPSASCPCTLVP